MVEIVQRSFTAVRDFIVYVPRWLLISLLWWYFAVVGWALITHGGS